MKTLIVLLLLPVSLLASDMNEHELEWLIGCWQTPDGAAQEVWVAENDDTLAGFAVSLRNNKVSFYEVLTIKRSPDGLLVYTAHPSGQTTTSFVAMQVSDDSALFVNADHDYPQAIRYSRDGNHLAASSSLLDGSQENSFNKIACD